VSRRHGQTLSIIANRHAHGANANTHVAAGL
jgi:hypothetical protein